MAAIATGDRAARERTMVALIPFAVAVGRADLRLDMEEAKGQLGADARRPD